MVPIFLSFSLTRRRDAAIFPLLPAIAQLGMDGLECFPPQSWELDDRQIYFRFAREHRLLPTSGSDYHAKQEVQVEPGDNIFPEECREAIIEVFRKQGILEE